MNATNRFMLGFLFLLVMVSSVSAIPLTTTVNSPANNSATGEGATSVLLSVTFLNVNLANATRNLTNVTFKTGAGVILNTQNNTANNTAVTFNYSGLSAGTYSWYAEGVAANGTGNTTKYFFTVTEESACFADASGTTLVILLVTGVLLVLFVALLFLSPEIITFSFLISAIIALVVILAFLPGIC